MGIEKKHLFVASLALSILVSNGMDAQDYTWANNGSGEWTDVNSWSQGGGYPQLITDNASIQNTTVPITITTSAPSVTYDELTFITTDNVTITPGGSFAGVHIIDSTIGCNSVPNTTYTFAVPIQFGPDAAASGFNVFSNVGTVQFMAPLSEATPGTLLQLSFLTGGSVSLVPAFILGASATYTGGTTIGFASEPAVSFNITGSATLSSQGTVTVNSGIFDISAGPAGQTIGDLVGVSGTVNLGGNTLTVTSNPGLTSFPGAITGAGGNFIKQGSGNLSLSGPLTYTGATTVSNGLLSVLGPNALNNSSQITVGTGASLSLLSYNGTILSLANLSGTGGGMILAGNATISIPMTITPTTFDGSFSASSAALNISGSVANTINLTGSSTFAQVTLSGATTVINSSSSLGSGSVPLIFAGGNLTLFAGSVATIAGSITFNTSSPDVPVINVLTGSSLTFSGPIFQNGGDPTTFAKIGAGTLTLANNANASPGGINGMITLSSGPLVAISDAALGTITGTLTFGPSGGVANPTLVAGGTISSTRPILLNDYAVFDTNGSTITLAGDISGLGFGFTKVGSGTLVLSGTNTFTGMGTVSSGVLQIAIEDAVNNASQIVVGSVTSPATLQAGSDNLDVLPDITVAAGGGIFDSNGFSAFFNTISGTGSVAITGTGSIIFVFGGNYSGNTYVQQGTLVLGNTILSNTVLDISAGATFDVSQLDNPQVVGDLTGAGTVILTPSMSFTVGTGNSTTFSGMIADGTITGGNFTKAGTGTLTLSGTLNYSGGTTIANGALLLTDNAITTAKAISNDEMLIFSPSDTRAFNWLITGLGSVTVQGPGSVSWTGLSPNTYSGTTSITSGTLELNMNISSGSAIVGSLINIAGGNLVLGSIAPSNQINSPSTNMALSAGMFNVGANQVTLGALSYSGGSIAGGGTINLVASGQALAISAPNSTIQSTISLATAGSTIVNNSSVSTINNVIFNAGGSQISSTGNLVLNASSGGAFTLTAGTLTLNTGTHNYGSSAPTLQAGSTLVLQGDMTASALNVNAGATMQGSGTFNGSLNLQGSLTPGNSIGTINLSGAQTFGATSILVAEISNSSSSADLVNITGSLTITPGAILQIVPVPNSFFTEVQAYTLVQATSGITGTFQVDASNLLAGTLYQVVYTGNSIILELQGQSLLNLVSQGNPGRVAQVLDSTVITPGTDLFNVVQALQSINNIAQLIDALNQMQPSMLKGLLLAQENSSIRVQQGISLRMENLLSKACFQDINRLTLWTDGLGDYSHQSSKGLEPGLNSASGGLTLGVDYKATHGFGGLAASYTYSNVVWQEGRGLGNINSAYGSIYGGLTSKHFYVDALFEASYSHYNEKRRIVFPGISRTARGHFNGGELLGHLELGGLTRIRRFEFQPFISSELLYLHAKAFHETGADSINLNLHSSNYVMLRSELGMNFSRCFPWDTYSMRIDGKLSYIREDRFQGSVFKTSFLALSDNFNVHGLNPDRNLFSPALSLVFLPRNQGAEFSLNYEGEFGSSFWDQNVRLQYGYRF